MFYALQIYIMRSNEDRIGRRAMPVAGARGMAATDEGPSRSGVDMPVSNFPTSNPVSGAVGVTVYEVVEIGLSANSN